MKWKCTEVKYRKKRKEEERLYLPLDADEKR